MPNETDIEEQTRPDTVGAVNCAHCGQFTSGNSAYHNGSYYCNTCSDMVLTTCDKWDCGKPVRKTSERVRVTLTSPARLSQNKGYYCRPCCEEHTTCCSRCDSRFVNSAMNEHPNYSDRKLCHSCYDRNFKECNECGEIHDKDEMRRSVDSNWNCMPCWEVNHFECGHCGNSGRVDEAYRAEGHKYCSHCTGGSNDVYNYSFRPIFRTFGHKATEETLTFGFELEMESNGKSFQQMITKAREYLGDLVYFKNDGSLNNGCEMVTHPFTLEYFKTIKKNLKKFLDEVKALGWRSYDSNTCGIHIHLNKKSFGTTHLLKFLEFFYKHPNYIAKISQRGGVDKLNQWATLGDGASDGGLKYKAKTKGGTQKYTAVNLSHTETAEIRIFRGNLHYPAFLKNVEFAEATFRFAKDEGMSRINTTNFNNYVKANYHIYPNLWNFIVAKKLVEITN